MMHWSVVLGVDRRKGDLQNESLVESNDQWLDLADAIFSFSNRPGAGHAARLFCSGKAGRCWWMADSSLLHGRK